MPKKQSEIVTYIWDQYNQAKIDGENLTDQTEQFFAEISPANLKLFQESNNQVIHFGCGLGSYVSTLPHRRTIGYEYSPSAIQYLQEHNSINTIRNVDLDAITDGTLSYQSYITTDLNHPADILMVRLLEYLSDDALLLLLSALIQQAQPNTTFYIEVSKAIDTDDKLEQLGFIRDLEKGYVASFFAPRTDMEFISHTQVLRNETSSNQLMSVERLLVAKI